VSNVSKRTEGAAERFGGKVKKYFGKLIGNERMEAEGRAKELKGQAKVEAAKAAERVKGKVEEAAGSVQKRAGEALDRERMEAEGKAREAKGEARQDLNKPS